MKMLCVLISVIGIGPFTGQEPGHRVVRDFPNYRLIEGAVDSDGFPTSGAKICAGASSLCFQMPSNGGYSKGSVVYDFGLDPQASRLPLASGGSIVLFSATFSAGGSGSLDRLAFLRYNDDGTIIDLLPLVGLTNQSERATWLISKLSNYPILLTADFDWMQGETHFARHYYVVSAYRFDPATDKYSRVFRYKTSRKYAGLDETDAVRVIEPERAEIMQRLNASIPVKH
jgi:hypothetical protein